MPKPGGHEPRFAVHGSEASWQRLLQIQRRAAREGRGDQVLTAFKHIAQRLQDDPTELGEPNYRLSALRLDIRTCAVGPLVVDFAVHLDKPLVVIKGVKLLSRGDV